MAVEIEATLNLIHFTDAQIFRMRGGRILLTFNEQLRGDQLPAVGVVVDYVAPNGKMRMKIVAAVRPYKTRSSRGRLIFRARRVAELLAENHCTTCHGTGAIAKPAPCPECVGRGCVECDDVGMIDYSDCPVCTPQH